MTVAAMSLITASLGRIAAPERRTMGVACGAHVLHDGYTDLLYVLLPLWQAEFGLGYAEVGLLRALYTGSMASFQVPAGGVARAARGALPPPGRGGPVGGRHILCRAYRAVVILPAGVHVL